MFLKLFVILFLPILAIARSIDHIKESGEIIIAVYEDFPPYSFKEKGIAKGIDVEIGKLIAKSLNVKPVWYFTGFDENLSADLRNTIWRGNLIHKTKADMMLRIPYDYDYLRVTDKYTGELENERVSIKAPYQSEKWIIATHKKVIPEIKTLGIFAYNTIGVEVDTLPDFHFMNTRLINKNVKHYNKFEEAFKDFKDGKIDAIAGLKTQLQYLLDYKKNKDLYYLTDGIPMLPLNHWDLATAVSSSYKDLSYHIDNVVEDAYKNGTIKKIFEKFNVEYQAPISKTQK